MSFVPNYAAFEYFVKKGDREFQNWLYGSWDKEKLDRFNFLYSVPGIRNYIDYQLDKRSDEEYLDRYSMSYSDIHDPRKLKQVSSGSRMISHSYDMISKNVGRLYK